jgi:hypothetical protein
VRDLLQEDLDECMRDAITMGRNASTRDDDDDDDQMTVESAKAPLSSSDDSSSFVFFVPEARSAHPVQYDPLE